MNKQTRAFYKIGVSVIKTKNSDISKDNRKDAVSFAPFPQGKQPSKKNNPWKGAAKNNTEEN